MCTGKATDEIALGKVIEMSTEPAVGCPQTTVFRKNGWATSPSTSTTIPKSMRL